MRIATPLRILKRVVERSAPALASSYRLIRDDISARRLSSRQTPFGFGLVGDQSMQDGTFEPEETALLQERLTVAELFVDVGANIGYYTCLALSKKIPVISVEPLPSNLRILFRNLQANGWSHSEVWPMGVSSRPGLVDIFGGGTAASIVSGWAGSSEAFRQTIAVTTLDLLLRDRFAGKRLLIKVDVEGAEEAVLGGASETLARATAPEWLVEITLGQHLSGGNPNFARTFETFWSHGYEARTGDAERRLVQRGDIARWQQAGKQDFGGYSWFFSKAT